MLPHLDYPIAGKRPPVKNGWANIYTFEPYIWRYTDGTMGFHWEPGAVENRYHDGIDWAVPCMTRLYACGAGVCVFAERDPWGFGLCLQVKTGPVIWLLGHLAVVYVKRGDLVSAGQLVALSGGGMGDWRDGNSNGCHTHMSTVDATTGTYLTGHYRDPRLYFKAPLTPPQPRPPSPLIVPAR